ncbi:MAG: threonine/serine exporter family protein [Pseudomonadota bacterium]
MSEVTARPWPIEVRFLRLLATRLHEYGTAAHRLENAVSSAAERLGCHCDVFSTPTSVFLSFRDETDPTGTQDAYPTMMIRLRPGSVDLGKLRAVDEIADEVAAGTIDLDEGAERLLAVPNMPPVAPLWGQLLSWAVVGATVAALLGSTWTDIGIATVLGLLAGTITTLLGGRWQDSGSFEPLVAFLVTVAAYGLSALAGGASVPNVVIGALIILMPGLDLTVAVTELSTGHLASGTARFAGALVVLLKLALGVMLATQLMTGIGLASGVPADPQALSAGWFVWVSMLAAGLAFAVLFAAQRRDWIAVVVAAMVSFITNTLATQALGPEVGVFLAALVVAAVSNGYARLFNRPATVMRTPGIILLVPGSLGYRALNFLFSRNIEDGLDAAVSVTVILAALVGGLLLGNTFIAPRRNL